MPVIDPLLPLSPTVATGVKIPKERTVIAKTEDGRDYVKSVSIRFPVLAYLLSLPVRAYRRVVFELRVRGIVPIRPVVSEDNRGNTNLRDDDAPVQATPTEYGPVRKRSIACEGEVDGQSILGTVTIEFEHIHPDAIDGTDILRFSWRPDDRASFVTFHGAEFFLRALIDKRANLSAQFLRDADPGSIKLFSNSLCVQDAKALVDERSYEHIRVSGRDFEIRLKYTGLLASLAEIPDDAENILVLLSGVIGTDDILAPFLVTLPFSLLADGSTAAYDDEEQEWQTI